MVLITPRLEPDLTSPHGGQLVVSFPTGSECDAFSVLIKPSLDILGGWKVYVSLNYTTLVALRACTTRHMSRSFLPNHYLDR